MTKQRKFKIGDRVKALGDSPEGRIGIVRFFWPEALDEQDVLVEFEDWSEGHSCLLGSTQTHNYGASGWWCFPSDLELLGPAVDMRTI